MTCLLAPSVRHERHRFQFEQPRTHQPRQKEKSQIDATTTRRPAEVPWCEVSHERVGLSLSIGSPTSCAPACLVPALRHSPEADGEGGNRRDRCGWNGWSARSLFSRLLAVRPKRCLIGICLRGPASAYPDMPGCRYLMLELGSADEVPS